MVSQFLNLFSNEKHFISLSNFHSEKKYIFMYVYIIWKYMFPQISLINIFIIF